MMEEEGSAPPLLFRKLIGSAFILADKSKLVQLIRYVVVSSLLFFLRFFFLVLPLNYCYNNNNSRGGLVYGGGGFGKLRQKQKKKKKKNLINHSCISNSGGGGDSSGIGRALSQLLTLVNDIPVNSNKYQVVRSLAETLIHDNHKDGLQPLRHVNRTVLSKAFSNSLSQLEEAAAATLALEQQGADSGDSTADSYRLSWLLRAARSIGGVAYWKITGGGSTGRWSRSSAEKLGAEVLWLAHKLAACGYGDEAVGRWASATHLAWLSLSVEPRLQASLVKVSALLFKHAKHIGMDEEADGDESKKEQQKQTKMAMLMSWMPLLCRASNGADVPVLSIDERAELERVLEEIIETLEEEEDQEKVLSLWLHHFTHCSSSDWPNLKASYARWCNASRKLLLDQHHQNL